MSMREEYLQSITLKNHAHSQLESQGHGAQRSQAQEMHVLPPPPKAEHCRQSSPSSPSVSGWIKAP